MGDARPVPDFDADAFMDAWDARKRLEIKADSAVARADALCRNAAEEMQRDFDCPLVFEWRLATPRAAEVPRG
jgi:hypothetical protein